MSLIFRILFRYFLTYLIILISSFAFFSTPALAKKSLDSLIASVNHEAITESQLMDKVYWVVRKMRQNGTEPPPLVELKQQVLDRLILERVQLDIAKKYKIQADEAHVEKAIKQIEQDEKLSHAQFLQALTQEGMDEKTFRDNMRNELTISKLQQQAMMDQIVVTQHEIDQFIQSRQNLKAQADTEYRVRHLLLALHEQATQEERNAVMQKAEQLIQQVKKGRSFASLAIEYSQGAQAQNGGDLGWRTFEQLPTFLVKVVPGMDVGEVHAPIRNDSGVHLVFLESKRAAGISAKNATEEKMLQRERAHNVLYEQKFEQVLMRWLRRMREEAQVDVFLNA